MAIGGRDGYRVIEGIGVLQKETDKEGEGTKVLHSQRRRKKPLQQGTDYEKHCFSEG